MSVKLHVADLAVTQAFYSDVLGMTDLFGSSTTTTTSGSPAAADEVLGSLRNDGDLVMGYSRDQVREGKTRRRRRAAAEASECMPAVHSCIQSFSHS